MAQLEERGRRPSLETRRSISTSEAGTMKPVKWWAAVGAFFVVLQVYIYTAWFVSGEATPTPTGPDPIPTWMQWSIYVQQVFFSTVALLCIYWFIVRPWRRDRRLTLDGMFVIGFFLCVWQDPLLNYWAPWTTTNAGFVNLGSWSANIPGWNTPNGNLYVEPLLWTPPAWIGALFVGTVLISSIMRKAKTRWPHLGKVGIILVALGSALVLDIIAETIWIRTGMYTYPGAIRSLSLFPGHYYQFPLYEGVLFAGTWTTWACIRYFRNDKGETLAERGIDQVRATPKQKTSLRLLAVAGMLNVILLVGYEIPAGWFALHADPWPEDILNRSYLTNELCGPGTSYACPGPSTPINRPDSWHIDPDGKLVEGG